MKIEYIDDRMEFQELSRAPWEPASPAGLHTVRDSAVPRMGRKKKIPSLCNMTRNPSECCP